MKKFDKYELVNYTLGVIATLMTINSTLTLLSDTNKSSESESHVINSIYFNINHYIEDFAFRKYAKLVMVNDGTYMIIFKDGKTTINLINGQMFISTIYIDGFKESHVIDLLNVNERTLFDCINHDISAKKEINLLERSQYIVFEYMKDRELSEEEVNEINFIIEQLLSLYSNFDNLTYLDMEQFVKNMFKVTQDELDTVVAVITREGAFKDCAAVSVKYQPSQATGHESDS